MLYASSNHTQLVKIDALSSYIDWVETWNRAALLVARIDELAISHDLTFLFVARAQTPEPSVKLSVHARTSLQLKALKPRCTVLGYYRRRQKSSQFDTKPSSTQIHARNAFVYICESKQGNIYSGYGVCGEMCCVFLVSEVGRGGPQHESTNDGQVT